MTDVNASRSKCFYNYAEILITQENATMVKIFTTMLVALAFSLTSALCVGSDALKPSPETVVTCQVFGGGIYKAIGLSVATGINTDQCIQPPDIALPCSQCISSLEDQGCKTLNVDSGVSNIYPIVTYFLSCAKP